MVYVFLFIIRCIYIYIDDLSQATGFFFSFWHCILWPCVCVCWEVLFIRNTWENGFMVYLIYMYISFVFCFLLKLMEIVWFEWIYTKSCLYCIYKSTATPNMNDKSSIYVHFTYLLITTIQSIFKLKITEFLASKISTSPNQFKSHSFNFV